MEKTISEFEERVVAINRVTKVVKGGMAPVKLVSVLAKLVRFLRLSVKQAALLRKLLA